MMKFLKFELNTIVFLSIIIAAILAWVAFEFYHQTSSGEITPELRTQASTPIADTFDKDTLQKLYTNKDKFYESTESSASEQ